MERRTHHGPRGWGAIGRRAAADGNADGAGESAVPGGRGRSWPDRLIDVFGADLRSLAVFRILIAAIVLLDLAGRAQNLRVHYSDEGVLPRSLLLDSVNGWRWSLHMATGTVEGQGILFLLHAAAAVGMMIGYRTRTMTIVVWVMTLSLQSRNLLVLSGADTLLRVLLFWSILLPLGAWWSVDRLRASRVAGCEAARLSPRYFSFATIGIFLQIAFMYWFTAILKSSPVWREDGTALFYALGADHITKPLGGWLHQYETAMQVLTFLSLGLEVVAPILLFIPFFTGPVRTLAALSIMVFHLGIFLMLDIGIFPLVSSCCMLVFFPTWFWGTALPWVRAALPKRVSSAAERSRGGVAQPAHALRASARRWVAVGRGALRPPAFGPSLLSSGVAGTNVVGASAGAPGNGMLGDVDAPNAPGDVVGTDEPDERPSEPAARPALTQRPRMLRTSPLINIVAAASLLIIFGWNMATVTTFAMPRESHVIGYGLGLYQKWNMFAPQPPRSTSWYVVRGVLENGRQLDMLSPIVQDDPTLVEPLSWEQPANIAGDLYRDKYWRKYLSAIAPTARRDERRAFAAYTCRTWNAHHTGDEDLRSITIVSVSVRTVSDDEEPADARRRVVAQYRCV